MKILSPPFVSNPQFQRGNKTTLPQSRQLTPSHRSRTIEVKRSQTSDGIRPYHQSIPLKVRRPPMSFQLTQIEQPLQTIMFNKFSHSFYQNQLKTIDLCSRKQDQPIHSRKSNKFNNILFAKKRAKSKSQSMSFKIKNVPMKSMIVARSCKMEPQQAYNQLTIKQIIKKSKMPYRSQSRRLSQRRKINMENSHSQYRPWSPKKGEMFGDEIAYY